MRPRARSPVVLLALLALAAGAGPVVAGDAPPSPSPRERSLKARAQEWLEARRLLYVECATCQGSGTVPSPATPGRERPTCPRCRGLRTRVHRDRFHLLHYDLMSPAWRARKGDRSTLDETLAAMDRGLGRPARVSSWVVTRVETLVGERFGLTWHKTNHRPEEIRTAWVWVGGTGPAPGAWYLYGGDVDGAWGAPSCDADPAGKAALEGPAAESVAAALAPLHLRHAVEGRWRAGDDAVLALAVKGPQRADDLAAAVRDDAIAVARALLAPAQPWKGVRLSFSAEWVDKFGQASSRVHVRACLSRTVLEKIVFENLKADAVFALFAVERSVPEGLTLRAP